LFHYLQGFKLLEVRSVVGWTYSHPKHFGRSNRFFCGLYCIGMAQQVETDLKINYLK
jgi:hypothetical protein